MQKSLPVLTSAEHPDDGDMLIVAYEDNQVALVNMDAYRWVKFRSQSKQQGRSGNDLEDLVQTIKIRVRLCN